MAAGEVSRHCSDCTELQHPTEAGVVENLCERYRQGLIYTNVSHVLLAVNPHRDLEHLYGTAVMQQSAAARGPHPYSLAQLALKRLRQGPQAIIVSGESGAGKTETAKIIMRFLESHIKPRKSSTHGGLEERMLAMSRVLESLGHAATRQNQNSSRFGKFLRLQLGRGCLSPQITTYLLEASRVVSGPSNFHIFYELLAGGNDLEKWGLSEVSRKQPRDRLERFQHGREELAKAMERLSLSHLLQPMLKVVAGITHLLSYLEERPAPASDSQLEQACSLLGLHMASFKAVLTTKELGVPKDKPILLERTEEQSQGILRSLVVTLYRKLFSSVVNEMNQALEMGMPMGDQLGILDMYGFENLETNQLEQLLINYTNEQLQLLFCEQVLLKEQQVYLLEGLLLEEVTLPLEGYDVLKTLDGILDLLDDWTLTRMRAGGKFSDGAFADAARKTQGSAKKVLRPAVAPGFAVRHFAGEVGYRCHGWLDSNDAKPLPEVLTLLQGVAWPLKLEPPRRSHSVSKGHRAELNSLLANLKNMHGLHFIRCYRPNKEQSSAWVDRSFLAKQLRGSGVLQLLQVMGQGFPHRIALKEVASSFAACLPGTEGCSDRLLAELLMHTFQVPKTQWRLGVSQLFLKPGQLACLEELSENPQPVDPLRIAAARRTARRLRWRRALHAVTLVSYLGKRLERRRRRRMKAAFLVCIFVFRLQRMRIKRGLTVRSEKKANKHVAIVEERMLEEKLEESTRPKMNASMEGMELNLSKAGHKRSRPPATPQEGGILLEMLRKRRLC